MSITSKFRFVGNALVPKDRERFYKEWKGGSTGKVPMGLLNFGVKENLNNVGYVSLFGMKRDLIKTKNEDNINIDVKWQDRFNEDIVKNIPRYKKIIVDLGEEFDGTHEFITELDAIEYLATNLPSYEGKIEVRGIWKKDVYKGKINDTYEISSVRAVPEDSVSKLQLTMEFFYNKDSIDVSEYEDSKKIIIDGYVGQYVNKEMGTQYFPQRAILSSAKYDMSNEKHVARWNNRKSYIDKLSSKKMYHMYWECRLINGAEEVEFDESMLTNKQREQIELGIRTLEYFMPKNAIYGTKIKEVRLFDAILTGDFDDGIIETNETLKEFNDCIFEFIEESKDVLEEIEVEDVEEDDDEESLF